MVRDFCLRSPGTPEKGEPRGGAWGRPTPYLRASPVWEGICCPCPSTRGFGNHMLSLAPTQSHSQPSDRGQGGPGAHGDQPRVGLQCRLPWPFSPCPQKTPGSHTRPPNPHPLAEAWSPRANGPGRRGPPWTAETLVCTAQRALLRQQSCPGAPPRAEGCPRGRMPASCHRKA